MKSCEFEWQRIKGKKTNPCSTQPHHIKAWKRPLKEWTLCRSNKKTIFTPSCFKCNKKLKKTKMFKIVCFVWPVNGLSHEWSISFWNCCASPIPMTWIWRAVYPVSAMSVVSVILIECDVKCFSFLASFAVREVSSTVVCLKMAWTTSIGELRAWAHTRKTLRKIPLCAH